MSSLEFDENVKKNDDSSKFGIMNVSEDSGTEVKDRDEQDGGYFDAIMEHNTEESTESIDSFIKKTTVEIDGKESGTRHTEIKDFVDDAHVFGSEEDSSYNLDEELEKETQVMDCESTDLELNDVSLGLSLQDTSDEEEEEDIMESEETDDLLSDKITGDGMDSDDENDLVKNKGDVITSDENSVTAIKGTDSKDLLTGDEEDIMVATDDGKVILMHAKRGRDSASEEEKEEERDNLMTDGENGKASLLAGEGTDMESIISGVGESSGSLLDTENVDRKKDMVEENSNVQVKVDVHDEKVDEATDLASVISGSLSNADNIKQDEIKKETTAVKTSQVHVKVDVLDKTVHTVHLDDKDKITRSGGKQIENTEKSKGSKIIQKGEVENIDIKNEKIQEIAAEIHEKSNNNPNSEDVLALKDQKHNEKCLENGKEATESVSKMKVGADILGKNKELMEGTPNISVCDGQRNKVSAGDVEGNKMNDIPKERVDSVESEPEVRKLKSKNAKEGKRDRDAEEGKIMDIRINLVKIDDKIMNVAQKDKDGKVQKEEVKKEDEKMRIIRRNQNKDIKIDQCKDVDSVKKSRTQINVRNEDDTDADIHDISDQQRVGDVLVKKTVSNIERVKRKIEEIMEKSKAEEDAFIEEIQQMKKEKADILDNISSEMKKLKSLLGNEKQEEQEK